MKTLLILITIAFFSACSSKAVKLDDMKAKHPEPTKLNDAKTKAKGK